MPVAGWRVMLLAHTGDVDAVVGEALIIAGFIAVCLLLLAANIYQRRRRLNERMALQERAKAELEERVQCRTVELSEANAHLLTEVAERRRAEAERLLMQAELIQATKLAALGQMSAGLSHELNQPLAAIRSYSDTTRAFLALGQHGRVASNLSAISELTERMARIIRHLRTFARKEPTEVGPVLLRAAIEEALELLAPRLHSEQVTVKMAVSGRDIHVVGGHVRLQQVFVNLFTNAADAMHGVREKTLEIGIAEGADGVVATVRDTGTGIAPGVLRNIFDPFFTTKEVGQGLGLGLSISYGIVQQFGGSIKAANHPDGGAVFTVRLARTDVAENIAV